MNYYSIRYIYFSFKPGEYSEAMDNDQNGEDTIQKDRLKRAKKIDGDIKGKICFN